MLRRCLSLMATCSAIALAARGAHGDLLLVRNGQPRSVIVTPAEPNDVVQLAAEELQYHLRKMSGAAMPPPRWCGHGLPARGAVGLTYISTR